MNATIEYKLKQLPDSPGIYKMLEAGQIIYIGKAKNLKNRVRSYFQTQKQHTQKVLAMVARVDDFDILLCDTELEALILECNLIKLHQPYFNILLKDDKHYPFVRIDLAQDYPRVELVRRAKKDDARYFGPYKGATVVREVLDVLRQVFPLRSCTRDMSKRYARPCVYYEMGRCLAPCAGLTTKERYHAVIDDVIAFLSGRHEDIEKGIKREMEEASAALNFEKAAILRDRLTAVHGLVEKQKAITPGGADQDVLYILNDGADALAQALFVREGKIIGGESFTLDHAAGETDEEMMRGFLLQYYDETAAIPREILLSMELEDADIIEALLSEKRGSRAYVLTPKRGGKAELIRMAEKNARDQLNKRRATQESKQRRTFGAMEALRDVLGMDVTPRRIEGFDISNTSGAESVASMVVLVDGMPAPKEYRKFKIKTVDGPNDFASMREVITRRFARALKEAQEVNENTEKKFSKLPDLVMVDGGPQQLKEALGAIADLGYPDPPPFIGLAERFEEIYMPERDDPIRLERTNAALHALQRLRDEAHRFALTYHRQLRAKKNVRSQLEDIPGVGPGRRRVLLSHFRSMDALKRATMEEIQAVKGMTKPSAEAVYKALHGGQGG